MRDNKIIQAVAQFWQRIGVQTTVDAMPWNTFVARAGKLEFSLIFFNNLSRAENAALPADAGSGGFELFGGTEDFLHGIPVR